VTRKAFVTPAHEAMEEYQHGHGPIWSKSHETLNASGRLLRPLVVMLILVWVVPAPGQATKADYERGARLQSMTRDKVFRDRVEPSWS